MNLLQLLIDFLLRLFRRKPRVRFLWSIDPAQPKTGTTPPPPMPLKLEITNEQKIKVSLTPTTDTGKPAKLDGAPTWLVQSGTAAVQAAEDGLSAELVSGDEPGDTEIQVSADADLGAGVVTVTDTILLTVVQAEAKNLGLSAGQPEPK
jgi:hypothetical protein